VFVSSQIAYKLCYNISRELGTLSLKPFISLTRKPLPISAWTWNQYWNLYQLERKRETAQGTIAD